MESIHSKPPQSRGRPRGPRQRPPTAHQPASQHCLPAASVRSVFNTVNSVRDSTKFKNSILPMDEISIKTKNLNVVFIGVHRLEILSVLLVFSTPRVTRPSNLLTGKEELHTEYLAMARFRTYKIALPPQTKF